MGVSMNVFQKILLHVYRYGYHHIPQLQASDNLLPNEASCNTPNHTIMFLHCITVLTFKMYLVQDKNFSKKLFLKNYLSDGK